VRPLLANSFIKNRQPYADLLQINTRPSAGLFRSGINANEKEHPMHGAGCKTR
jgi:hypothetical protein